MEQAKKAYLDDFRNFSDVVFFPMSYNQLLHSKYTGEEWENKRSTNVTTLEYLVVMVELKGVLAHMVEAFKIIEKLEINHGVTANASGEGSYF